MPDSNNITYTSEEIRDYYASHRITWDQFYPSEKALFERLSLDAQASVLDIGCGCAGLGLALRERFGTTDYTGIEINAAAAEEGRRLYPSAEIIAGDFLVVPLHRKYDCVISLSCIDWNVQFHEMLSHSYACLKPGGTLVVSLRLTDDPDVRDLFKAWQYINFDGKRQGERAPYVICSAQWIYRQFLALEPAAILADGYWGKPSATSEVPYDRLCFAVFGVKKGPGDDVPYTELRLPEDIVRLMSGESA